MMFNVFKKNIIIKVAVTPLEKNNSEKFRANLEIVAVGQ